MMQHFAGHYVALLSLSLLVLALHACAFPARKPLPRGHLATHDVAFAPTFAVWLGRDDVATEEAWLRKRLPEGGMSDSIATGIYTKPVPQPSYLSTMRTKKKMGFGDQYQYKHENETDAEQASAMGKSTKEPPYDAKEAGQSASRLDQKGSWPQYALKHGHGATLPLSTPNKTKFKMKGEQTATQQWRDGRKEDTSRLKSKQAFSMKPTDFTNTSRQSDKHISRPLGSKSPTSPSKMMGNNEETIKHKKQSSVAPAISQDNTSYYSRQDKATQKALSQYCDAADIANARGMKQLIFTNPKLDHMSDAQVVQTLKEECYKYQDRVAPQYSEASGGYYGPNKTEAKNQGVFTGGRIPGSKSVYSASCEIEKITSPKWYDNEADSERVHQQVNPYGNNSTLTTRFLNSQGSQAYKGSTKFCHAVP